MRYFAILKDSLREALDAKVLYVLLALSTIVIAFVGTLSFKPLSAEKTMAQFFFTPNVVPLAVVLHAHKPEKQKEQGMQRSMNALMKYKLVKTELVNGEPDAPESEYALTISQQHGAVSEQGVLGIFDDAKQLGYVEVGKVTILEEPNEEKKTTLYKVNIKGTSRMHRIWAAQPTLFFGAIPVGELAAPLGFQIYFLTSIVLSMGVWIALLIGVVITSFFIPNMLRKGTVDLLLVKPIQRWALLVYKYIGGLTFIFLSTAYAIGGIWLVLGIRTGLWAHWSLLLIFTVTFFFAILYAISTLVAVVTRSTVTAIMVTIGCWFLFFIVGTAYTIFNNQYVVEEARDKERAKQKANDPVVEQKAEAEGEDSRWGHGNAAYTVFALHKITPRTSDLSHLNDLIVYTDFMTGNLGDISTFDTSQRNWWESVFVSFVWITIFLGLASLWFTFKDY